MKYPPLSPTNRRIIITAYRLLTVILIIHSMTLGEAGTTTITRPPSPMAKAKKVTACLMNIVDQVVNFVGLAALLIAGITYITAAGDNQQQHMAKRYVQMAITGILFVKIVVAIITKAPFNLTADCCEDLTKCCPVDPATGNPIRC